MSTYSTTDAEKIFCIAILRALEPDINDYELGSGYNETWLSELYPDTSLSKNTVGDFLFDLGRTCSDIISFMRLRTGRVSADHHLAVDGSLVSDESDVNTFSDYSRKALKKGTRDISVVFAYDIETGEPVCSKVYPGNRVDISIFEDFITTNRIYSGMIIADKGFSYEVAKTVFQENPDLHFLIPLKRNASVIRRYDMYDFNVSMESIPGMHAGKRRSVAENTFIPSRTSTGPRRKVYPGSTATRTMIQRSSMRHARSSGPLYSFPIWTSIVQRLIGHMRRGGTLRSCSCSTRISLCSTRRRSTRIVQSSGPNSSISCRS